MSTASPILYYKTTSHTELDFIDLHMSSPPLSALHEDAANHSCFRRALSQCWHLHGREVHAAIVPRSHTSDAWQCRTPEEHQLPRGNNYQHQQQTHFWAVIVNN